MNPTDTYYHFPLQTANVSQDSTSHGDRIHAVMKKAVVLTRAGSTTRQTMFRSIPSKAASLGFGDVVHLPFVYERNLPNSGHQAQLQSNRVQHLRVMSQLAGRSLLQLVLPKGIEAGVIHTSIAPGCHLCGSSSLASLAAFHVKAEGGSWWSLVVQG